MSILHHAQAALQEERRSFQFDTKAVEVLILQDLGLSPTDCEVEFQVGKTWVGYGMAEHEASVFNGVKVSPKPCTPQFSPRERA